MNVRRALVVLVAMTVFSWVVHTALAAMSLTAADVYITGVVALVLAFWFGKYLGKEVALALDLPLVISVVVAAIVALFLPFAHSWPMMGIVVPSLLWLTVLSALLDFIFNWAYHVLSPEEEGGASKPAPAHR